MAEKSLAQEYKTKPQIQTPHKLLYIRRKRELWHPTVRGLQGPKNYVSGLIFPLLCFWNTPNSDCKKKWFSNQYSVKISEFRKVKQLPFLGISEPLMC